MGTSQGAMVALAAAPSPACDDAMSVQLTPKQVKVLRGVRSGLANKQIAYDLGIAEPTVKAHMTALMRNLNVHNRTQVAIAAEALMLHGA